MMWRLAMMVAGRERESSGGIYQDLSFCFGDLALWFFVQKCSTVDTSEPGENSGGGKGRMRPVKF